MTFLTLSLSTRVQVHMAPTSPIRGMADLSVTSAPKKDIDLFISHYTKDNSHTVYSTRLKSGAGLSWWAHSRHTDAVPVATSEAPHGVHGHTYRCSIPSLSQLTESGPGRFYRQEASVYRTE